MSVGRQNIFDLIGKDQSRYGHCLMTTFSFDYGFFEQRVMRALRAANIRNVNVFIDANYLDELLEESALIDSRLQQSYSLIPIEARGVFHPKIMLLIGPKQGLLVVGSGNISSSGMSSNDEVWGAFHVDGIESPNAPLFAAAWNYLKIFIQQAHGIHQTKLQWIYQTAPWIGELEQIAAGPVQIADGQSVTFLANTETGNIFSGVEAALRGREIKSLRVIAPYFDRNGKTLKRLLSYFNPQECIAVSDTEFGLLPIEMESSLSETIPFYNWSDVITDDKSMTKRLHAKMFHFKLIGGGEYLLLGSANATEAGLGDGKGNYLNEEAGLLIYREGNGDYLSDLKIDFSLANAIQITKSSGNQKNKGDTQSPTQYKLKIKHAEQVGNTLLLTLNKRELSAVKVGVFRNLREQPEYVSAKVNNEHISVELKGSMAFNFCALYNADERITSYAPLNNADQLHSTNPDNRFKDITRLADTMLNGEAEGLIGELLSHAQFNFEDDEFEVGRGSALKRGVNRAVGHAEKEFEKIDSKSFNEAASIQQLQNEILTKSGLVADILHQLSRGLQKQRDQDIADAEQRLTIDQETGTEGISEDQIKVSAAVIDGWREKGSIIKFLNKIEKWFTDNLEDFFNSGNRIDCPVRPITLKELQNVSSVLSLLIYFQGKTYRYTMTQFPMRVVRHHASKIEKLVKQYKLYQLKGQLAGYPDAAFFEVPSDEFRHTRKNLAASIAKEGLPDILIDQSEYKVNEYEESYLNDGILKGGDYNGIKGYLFFLVGRFLMNSNEKAGFKNYESPYVVSKAMQERLQIFSKTLFTLLNLHWMEREFRYFDLLVLNLLHNLLPFSILKEELTQIKEDIAAYRQKANKKNDSFESNLKRFDGLLKQYQDWFHSYSGDKKAILKNLSSFKGSQIVFHSQLGFSELIEKGSDSLWLYCPGFNYHPDKNDFAMRVRYQPSTILTFPSA